jgi:hypothetical protein
VVKEDIQQRRKEFEKEHPVKNFLRNQPVIIVFLVIITCLLTLKLSHQDKFIFQDKFVLISLFSIFLMLTLIWLISLELKLSKEQSWLVSPFIDFDEEYKGKVVSKISPRVEFKIPSYHDSFGIELVVEHHPASPIRFLLAKDPKDEDEMEYYVDHWEKPKPQ